VQSINKPIPLVCGCINAIDPEWGAVRNVSKCRGHQIEQKPPAELDYEYYKGHGVFDGRAPHVEEFEDAFGPLGFGAGGLSEPSLALEVGCGPSVYVPMFLSHGYRYLGIDPSRFACEWVSQKYQVGTTIATLEEFEPLVPLWPTVILAAHVLEHLTDAPAGAVKLFHLLRSGGTAFIIVPHGEDDPWNPDHLWFFTPESLTNVLERIGFVNVRTTVRKRVPHERFIYCAAVKP
jgi:SAM-dependent methyltransferase